ncbi:MAG: FecR domain-containing protein, partial [Thermoguttaceae bacterium]|nr:FecR domain-containing protein [Thermoguttaceae bacterium]
MANDNNDLPTLAGKFLDASLTDAEAERLETLLSDPDAAEFFNANIDVDALMENLALERKLEMDGDVTETKREFYLRLRRVLTAAACALTVVGVAIFIIARQREAPAPATEIARVVRESNCVWGKLPPLVGDDGRLGPGELELLGGCADVKFTCGAVVHLEPASKLLVVDAKRCVLQAGRAIVEARPASAKGFVFETPFVDVADEGTRFSIDVRESKTDVAVLDGSVL